MIASYSHIEPGRGAVVSVGPLMVTVSQLALAPCGHVSWPCCRHAASLSSDVCLLLPITLAVTHTLGSLPCSMPPPPPPPPGPPQPAHTHTHTHTHSYLLISTFTSPYPLMSSLNMQMHAETQVQSTDVPSMAVRLLSGMCLTSNDPCELCTIHQHRAILYSSALRYPAKWRPKAPLSPAGVPTLAITIQRFPAARAEVQTLERPTITAVC